MNILGTLTVLIAVFFGNSDEFPLSLYLYKMIPFIVVLIPVLLFKEEHHDAVRIPHAINPDKIILVAFYHIGDIRVLEARQIL